MQEVPCAAALFPVMKEGCMQCQGVQRPMAVVQVQGMEHRV